MLVVEDGTGVVAAESYFSLTAAQAYWEKRPQDPVAQRWLLSTTTNAFREGAAREGSSFLDVLFGDAYPGQPKTATQGLAWPRVNSGSVVIPGVPSNRGLYPGFGLAPPYPRGVNCPEPQFDENGDLIVVDPTIIYGPSGFPLTGLPPQIVTAAIELSGRALIEPLAPIFTRQDRLKREKAGDHENEYFDGSSGTEDYYAHLGLILRPVFSAGGGSPGWSWR